MTPYHFFASRPIIDDSSAVGGANNIAFASRLADGSTSELLCKFYHLLIFRVLFGEFVAGLTGRDAWRGGLSECRGRGVGSRGSRARNGRYGILVVGILVVRGSLGGELASQAFNHFARKIAVNLEVLDRDVQTFECVAEIKARGRELSDVLVCEGES